MEMVDSGVEEREREGKRNKKKEEKEKGRGKIFEREKDLEKERSRVWESLGERETRGMKRKREENGKRGRGIHDLGLKPRSRPTRSRVRFRWTVAPTMLAIGCLNLMARALKLSKGIVPWPVPTIIFDTVYMDRATACGGLWLVN